MSDTQGRSAAEVAQVERWRKRPVEVLVVRFEGAANGPAIARWCGGRFNSDVKPSDPSDVAYSLDIPTLEGVMRAGFGDYIIRGVKGEFYPCKPDIFLATYQYVGEQSDEKAPPA